MKIKLLYLIFILLAAFSGCEKDTEPPIGVLDITTNAITDIKAETATCGGEISNMIGMLPITARGVCWSTSQNPTIANNKTTDGSGTGSFTSSITGLTVNTTYYVRAYATNSKGTSYGEEKSFMTSNGVAVVTTNTVSNIAATTATCGGNVTSDGGFTVTARGVCWSTSQNPTISGSHTTNGSGTGSFTSSITGLTVGTTYYVRAYATNSQGTSYGAQRSFIASNCTSVTDIDGNTYTTVQIGDQCWMKENLRTTRYANGTTIALGSSTSSTVAYRYGSSSYVSTYGYLYNWKAVMGSSSSSSSNPSGVQGICPTGWHVPSDAEWTELTNFVSSQSQYLCNSNSSYIAKALASTTYWNTSTNTCAVGNTPTTNNATGFSALPSGGYYGSFYDAGYGAYFWSSTRGSGDYAYGRGLLCSYAEVFRNYNYKYYGFSVRCVRD